MKFIDHFRSPYLIDFSDDKTLQVREATILDHAQLIVSSIPGFKRLVRPFKKCFLTSIDTASLDKIRQIAESSLNPQMVDSALTKLSQICRNKTCSAKQTFAAKQIRHKLFSVRWKGEATILFEGKPTKLLIESERRETSKIFTAYAQTDQCKKKVGYIEFVRFRISKKAKVYRSEARESGINSDIYQLYGPHLRKGPKIFVKMLESPKRDKYKGVGTALMQAVTEYGDKKGCEGRIDLYACWRSHAFYYKRGMRATDVEKNKKIKAFAEQPGEPDSSSLSGVRMFMPTKGIHAMKEKILTKPIFPKVETLPGQV